MVHALLDVSFVLIGVIAGFLGSLLGLGGGFIIVPLTTLFLTLPSRIIAGTSTAVVIVNALASTVAYWRQGRIDMKSGVLFAVASVPGAYIGAHFSHLLPTHIFNLAFGIFLIFVSGFLMVKPTQANKTLLRATTKRSFSDASGQHFDYEFNLPAGLSAGLLTGFMSSLFGIGGGTIMVPVMILLLGFPVHIAAATSTLIVLVSSTVGTVSHAMLGDVLWTYALYLAVGALIGGIVGPRLASRISSRWLLRILGIVMIATAVRMMV